MNYNSKRLTNPLKPICRCKRQEFNTLVDVVCGSTSTKEHNKNLAFKKALDELTFPCTDKDDKDEDDSLTLAEIVKTIDYPTADEYVSIDCEVFDGSNDGVKPSGFFILVGNDNKIKSITSVFYDGYYRRNDLLEQDQKQLVNSLWLPLTDKDITLIKETLIFSGTSGADWNTKEFRMFNSSYTGTIYMYKLNGTD